MVPVNIRLLVREHANENKAHNKQCQMSLQLHSKMQTGPVQASASDLPEL